MATTHRAFKWKLQLLTLYYGMIDARTPFFTKLPALLALAYLISPIDIIPDFIPVAGYIDDLLIAPLLLNLSFKLLPQQVLISSQVKAKKKNLLLTFLFIIAILLMIALIIALFFILKKIFWY